MTPLILGSESTYKKQLLARLRIQFDCFSPQVDESHMEYESFRDMSRRLSETKALATINEFQGTELTVIGADQTAECEGELVRKPGNHQQAVTDLMNYSTKTVHFFTSATIICSAKKFSQTITETTSVTFRDLSQHEIDAYLQLDTPYQCAGAFKCEGLGISLFESIQSQDPFTLIGLPLIGISRCLRELGYNLYQPEKGNNSER